MTQAHPTKPRRPRRLPGYFASKRALAVLHRFQDLIRHDQRWGGELQRARPIEELLPPNTSKERLPDEIDTQINRLIIPVRRLFWRIGVEPKATFYDSEPVWDAKRLKWVTDKSDSQTLDLVLDYFQHPKDPYATAYKALMAMLDRAIGAYEERRDEAKWELVNPLAWAASALYAPLWVFERAGLIEPFEPPGPLLNLYLKVVQALILIALALLVGKLGISVPWDKVF